MRDGIAGSVRVGALVPPRGEALWLGGPACFAARRLWRVTETDLVLPTRDDVLAARATIAGRVHRTPTFGSATLCERIGARAFLKAELFQKTGSFKPRGVLNKLASLSPDEKARGAVTWSAGNHAQAVAWAAASQGIDALVVMAQGASAQKIAAT